MTETQTQAPVSIRRTRLGMESEHFRIVVYGRMEDVLLGAFPVLGEVVIRTGVGFKTETPFTAIVDEPSKPNFSERVRIAATKLLEEAERQYDGYGQETAIARILTEQAENALRADCDRDGHLWTGEGRCSACGVWVVLGKSEVPA